MSVNPVSKPTLDADGDIPEAIRNASVDAKAKPPSILIYRAGTIQLPWLIFAVIGCGVGIIAMAMWVGFLQGQRTSSDRATPATQPTPAQKSARVNSLGQPEQKFGHYPYGIAPESELELVLPAQTTRLRKVAAAAFRDLVTAAGKDGVSIALISGFRDLDSQKSLFYDVMQERGQTPQQRAEVSAPPGFSEHHTGYAVDIGDSQAPATNLSPSFEQTRAFAWMQKHVAQYHWELSFPQKNRQGVNYEPWHWRYVGDRQSRTTFSTARSQALPSSSQTLTTQPQRP